MIKLKNSKTSKNKIVKFKIYSNRKNKTNTKNSLIYEKINNNYNSNIKNKFLPPQKKSPKILNGDFMKKIFDSKLLPSKKYINLKKKCFDIEKNNYIKNNDIIYKNKNKLLSNLINKLLNKTKNSSIKKYKYRDNSNNLYLNDNSSSIIDINNNKNKKNINNFKNIFVKNNKFYKILKNNNKEIKSELFRFKNNNKFFN